MKKSWRNAVLFLSSVLLVTGLVGCGGAASPAGSGGSASQDSFPSKDIELVVGYAPGGGYSDWAQAIAPFIQKHLPNEVNVLVRNMEGAGSAIAANYVQKAAPDGYTIGVYNLGGLAGTQLAREVQYDLSTVTWLARMSLDPAILTVGKDTPFQTVQDVAAKQDLIVSTKGLAANATLTGAATLAALQNTTWEPLNHDGTSESILAVIRGDADATWGSIDSQKQYIDSGDLRMLLYYDSARHPDYPEVPIPSEVGLPAEMNEAFNTHRLIGAPPGLPEDIFTILEDAIKKALEDPEFLQQVEKMEVTVNYLNGADTTEVVNKTLAGYESYKDVVVDLLSK